MNIGLEMKLIFRCCLVLCLLFGMSNAHAAPGSRSWSDDAPQTNDAPPQQIPGQQTGTNPTVASPTQGNNATNDPCPEPRQALGSTPDDLARIQEDITRFTLCVQRAQLLERLNELAKANIETIDSALNLVATPLNNQQLTSGTQGQGNSIMGDIPVPALPDSISQMLQDDASDEAMNQQVSTERPARERRRTQGSAWRIRDIQGSGGNIHARLMDDQGTILKVSQGDSLPDDGGRVSSITNSFVRVTQDDESTNLRWVD